MPGDEAGSEKDGVTRAGRRLRWGGAVMRCSIGDVSAALAKAGEGGRSSSKGARACAGLAALAKAGEGVLEARAKGNIF